MLIVFSTGGLIWLGLRVRTIEGVLALVAGGALITHGMLEYPLEYAFFLLPLGLILGAVSKECSAKIIVRIPKWFSGGLTVLAVAVMALVWSEYRVIEDSHRQMRFENARLAEWQGGGQHLRCSF